MSKKKGLSPITLIVRDWQELQGFLLVMIVELMQTEMVGGFQLAVELLEDHLRSYVQDQASLARIEHLSGLDKDDFDALLKGSCSFKETLKKLRES
jgi:hypothetical protein